MNACEETLDENSSKVNFRPIKIAHVIYRFDFGGLENGLVNIINGSPEWISHIIVTLNGSNPVFAKRLHRHIDIISVDKKPGKDLAVYFRLWKVLRRIKPDVVHTRNLSAIEAQIPALLAGVSCRVHSEHGWDIRDPNGDVKKYQLIRKAVTLLVHRVIPLSRQLESYLTDKVKIPARKITRICNGVDLERFQSSQLSCGHIEGIDKQRFVLMSIGRLEKIKGHRYLISALSELYKENPDVSAKLQVVIVGDGSQGDALQKQTESLGLSRFVHFFGSRSDIPELLMSADCFVLPSLAEGISNTILEAMACGLPVIATSVGGNGDLVADKRTGMIVNSADPMQLASAIKSYLSNPDLASEHGKAGLERAKKHFSLAGMVSQYLAVYTQCGNAVVTDS